MYTRLEGMPVFELRETQLNALHYNHVQVGLKRIHRSLRYRIPGLKHLDLILQKNEWVIVDRVLNDIPIAAWTDFETQGRSDLHQPINCKLRLYHIHAHMILERTIEAMELLLGEELANMESNDDNSDVLPFDKK